MIYFLISILLSFLFTFAITIPFIDLLYRLNIRRIPKADLEAALPGRAVKMGTPIMGGFVIVITVVIFSTLILSQWTYYYLIIIVMLLGSIAGFIDEYTNTLGRTFKALRISKSDPTKSLYPVKGPLYALKKIFLFPWKLFEEALRVSGSTQKGMQSHIKFSLHFIIALIIVVYLYYTGHSSNLYLPVFDIVLNLNILYYVILLGVILFFETAFGVTDGMDGLSAGLHSIAFGFYGILAAYLGYNEIAYLCFIILGSELAFLYFNIYPARYEMSDVGTVPLGMIFVLIAALMQTEISIFFIGGVFLVELVSSLMQQWSVKLFKKRVFLVAPIHHHFEKLGWHESKITMRFWLFGVVLGLMGLLLSVIKFA